jgi:hypothetical protein
LFAVPVTHAPPPTGQQPVGQFEGMHGGGLVQVPVVQVCAPVQVAQATPPAPQALVDVPATHAPAPLMQPVHAWQEPEVEQTSPF